MLNKLMQRLRARAPVAPSTPPRPFQAVAIFPGASACEQARELADVRLFAKDAPTLPLPECTAPQQCECRFLKYKDRRAGERRSFDFRVAGRDYRGEERRRLQSRRRDDA